MVCITEDWFALSHFRPLIRALVSMSRDVVVVTRSSGRIDEVQALGARTIDFDYLRASSHPLKVWQTARALRRLIASERPDAIHLVALKPIVTAAMALRGIWAPAVGVHLTGFGLLSIATTARDRLVRHVALSSVRMLVRRPRAWLFVENDDDLQLVIGQDAPPSARVTILGGAGIDPTYFAPLPQTANTVPVAAFVGRMIRSKGIDVLLDAARILRGRGQLLQLDLYGKIDIDNPEAVSRAQIDQWHRDGLALWHGHVDDVRDVWRISDISVMASLGGEGLPRSMLEAAACGRPLVVTDVPGCRQFVRHGMEGLVVPAGDAGALADALAELAANPAMRAQMATAARARVVAGFTEADLEAAVVRSYRTLLDAAATGSDRP